MPVPVIVSQSGIEEGKDKFSGKAASLEFMVTGAADRLAAYSAVLADIGVPTVIDGKLRIDSEIEVVEIGATVWRVTVPYSVDSVQPSTFTISFDISGQTTRLTQSKSTIICGRPGKTPKNFRGAIGVNQDGSIDGVDVYVPFLTACYNYLFAGTSMNSAYVRTLYKTVGKMNAAPWGPYDKGEAILTKVTGQRKDNNYWELVFSVAASENKTNIKIGDPSNPASVITVVSKAGWQYLWVYYEEEKVDMGSGLTYVHKVPASAYVENVYDSADYTLRGINPTF
jgi:hypothetical protein